MSIAICLLTCDRSDLTVRTLESLASFNDLGRFMLLHGDDASTDTRGSTHARALGFSTVVQSEQRRGVAAMTAALFEAAFKRNARCVLNLQNDWECLRRIPIEDLVRLFIERPDVYCTRLYGEFKAPGMPAGNRHGGLGHLPPVFWNPLPGFDGFELGSIHWGHPPAVTRIVQACALTRGATSEKASRRRSGEVFGLTARVIENVFTHIGYGHHTPGFKE